MDNYNPTSMITQGINLEKAQGMLKKYANIISHMQTELARKTLQLRKLEDEKHQALRESHRNLSSPA